MNVIFMGTPEFSVPTLCKLHENNYHISLVVTQPDKPSGRGKKFAKSDIKIKAEELGLKVFQPEKIKLKENVEILKSYKPDVIVVIAYGQILSKEILDIPKYGCINVHASLLPKYRGAAPINFAIINGEKISGVTTMKMDVGLDTGDMLLKSEIVITENMNAGQLHDELMIIGANLLVKTLNYMKNNEIHPIKQDELYSSYAPMLTKEMGLINWEDTAENIHNKIRGLHPWPCAYFLIDNKPVKVFDSRIINKNSPEEVGTVINVQDDGIYIKAKDGTVIIKELQMPGKKRMKVDAYLRGNKFSAERL